jgi:hypothetical protein
MDSIVFRYRARDLTHGDISFIRSLIGEHYAKGRSHISRVLCEAWNWFQPNGGPKEYAARDLLLRLEEKGFVSLPPRLRPKNNLKRKCFDTVPDFEKRELRGRISEFPKPAVRVTGPDDRYLFDWLLHRHHYLGMPGLVGEHLRHFALIDGQVVACLAWAGAAWKIGSRDRFIGWDAAVRRKNLCLVANNTRFLILPWIGVGNLASKVLSLSLGRLNRDWRDRYGHGICLAETFVDHGLYKGTCYRASNWRQVGRTRGSAKRGNTWRYHGSPKSVWLYPLRRDFRRRLCDEKG